MKKMLNKICYKKALLTTLITASAMSYASTGSAALTNYSENFESFESLVDATSPTALSGAGFVIYRNVYKDQFLTDLQSSIGPSPALNNMNRFAHVVTGEGGTAQGVWQLRVISDYSSGAQLTNYVDALTLQQQTIGPADLGSTWSFSFDAKLGDKPGDIANDVTGDSSAFAWIRAIDGGNTLGETRLETTSLGLNWGSYTVSLLIDPSWNEKTLEFGFKSAAKNYSPSGGYYDNLSLTGTSAVPVPAAVWLFGSGLLGLVGVARRSNS
jgi:hypothetical protein